ncbi:beta-ketoacyl synthase [bacterium]|nr:MAG: beta-ketoacyl synthase [bacterium]
MKALIHGIGWVASSGFGRGGDHSGFSLGHGALPRLRGRVIFAEPLKRFERLDDFSRLGFSGIALALRDAGLDQWRAKRNIGTIASTRYGCLTTDLAYFDTVIQDGGVFARPNLFAYTLSSCFLGEAAICFGLIGASFVINEYDSKRMGAIRYALDSLDWEECETIIAGFCDLPAPEQALEAEPVAPGTVFLVMGNGSDPSHPTRDIEVTMAADGAIIIGTMPVADWPELVQVYLAMRDSIISENMS